MKINHRENSNIHSFAVFIPSICSIFNSTVLGETHTNMGVTHPMLILIGENGLDRGVGEEGHETETAGRSCKQMNYFTNK